MEPSKYSLSPTRWYVLSLFSFVSMAVSFQFYQFAPVYQSLTFAFQWSDRIVELEPLYVMLTAGIGMIPGAFLFERLRLRKSMIAMSCLTLASFGVRCIAVRDSTLQAVLINVSAVLNGLAAVFYAYMPVNISAQWFHPSERTLATSIGMASSPLGGILGSVITATIIPDPNTKSVRPSDVETIYFHFTFVQTGIVAFATILTLIYFPDSPKTPPSKTAEAERTVNLNCLKQILMSRNFWILMAHYLLAAGGWFSWIPVVAIDVANNGVGQLSASYITLASCISGYVGNIIFAKLGDIYPQSLKPILVAMTALTLLSSVWIAVLTRNYLSFSLREFYFPVCILSASAFSIISIEIELGAENLYPLDEVMISGVLQCAISLLNALFIFVLLWVPASTGWMDWYLLGSSAIAMPLAFVLPNAFMRTRSDNRPPSRTEEKTA